MSDSEDDRPIPSVVSADNSDDDGPSTSWGLKRRSKCAIISDSENDDDDEDDDDDLEEEVVKDGESGDSDSSDSTPGAKTCAICLGRMRGEVGSPDACEHTFCKFCLLEWAKNNATCPQDRIPFTSVLVRKVLGGPISKEVPIPKGPAPDVYEFVETENPTYCEVCNQCNREDRLLLCDGCDLGYHLECLNPPLTQVPVEEWFCPICVAVDVPETLSYRLSSSSSRSEQARRSSSRSGNISLDQQELRIPRTRATERIREQIQKKKRKNKRRRQRRCKKAKISSEELEDTRQPVSQYERFRFFIEEDNDIDAEHTEDRYADQLLAGAIHKSARYPAQRKADAARHLRDVAYIPHASYSGRVKNKVLAIVNIHSEETDNDLLSGILENQTIAFSSSKKLLLTNDRKLIKQPDANFSCNVFQETDSLLLEPLPSQRKSPEKHSLASCSNEGSSSDPCKELHKKEDSDGDKQSSSSERQRSPTRALHHSSSYKEKHGCSYEDKNSYKRASDCHKKDDHNKYIYTHKPSRYSNHDRHHSSQGNSSHYEPSCSYTSKDKSYVSSRWKEKRDHRGYHSKHESHEKYHSRDRSPHRRNRSPGRENRRERKGSPSSSIYKPHDRKSHFSRSHKLHARSKEESSHSLGRSQWSFGYFNSNDSIITKNNGIVYKNNPITSGTEVQNNSKNIQDKSFSEESTISRSLETFVHENGCHSSVDNHEQQNPSQAITCHGVSDPVEGQRLEGSLSDMNEVSVSIPGHCLNNEGEPNSEGELNKNCKEIVQKENSYSRGMMVPKDDKQDQKKYIVNKISDNDDYKRTGKSSLKLPVFKKTKMSALFGEFGNGTTTNLETKDCKVHTEDDGDLEEERVKYSKTSKKSKTELLFGNDSDSNSNSDEVLGYRHEITKNKSGKIFPKGTGNNGGNSSHIKNLKCAISECEAEEYDPICGSMYHSFTIGETEIKFEKSQEDNKVISGCAYVDKLPTATAPTEKDFEDKDRVSWTKHVSEENELKMEGGSHTKHSIKELEVEEMDKFYKKRNENFSRNNNGKDRKREQKNHVIGRKALENGADGDKYVSRNECYSASHEKCHRGEKEIMLNYKFGISEKELNPLLGGKHSIEKRKLKASDNDNIANAKKESKSDLHKKHHTNSKEPESQNNINQRIRSDSYLSEIQNSKGKDSDFCGKVPSKGKEEILLKYNSNEEELDAVEKLHMKERELSESLDEKGKVKIPEKYKQKLSQLENLISKDNGTDFWEMPTFGNDYVIKVDNSKNNGVGRKSSSKGSFLFEKKSKEKGDCSAFKESEKKDNSLLKYSKCTDAKLEIDGSADFVLKIDKKKMKVRQDFSQDKKQKDGHILSDLFGDIDDIGSSSCSNLPETQFEDQPQSARIKTCPKESVKDGKMHISFEGEIMKPKDFHGDVALGGCDSVVLTMDGKHTDNEADGKGFAMFRCTPVSEDKANSAVRNDASSRIKQQKALLEARVVEEVKKSLDPFYRSKSITKDEYKQIVAKCVKKTSDDSWRSRMSIRADRRKPNQNTLCRTPLLPRYAPRLRSPDSLRISVPSPRLAGRA